MITIISLSNISQQPAEKTFIEDQVNMWMKHLDISTLIKIKPTPEWSRSHDFAGKPGQDSESESNLSFVPLN